MASPVMVPQRRRSFAGPIVLILIGVLFLLHNFGYHLPWHFLANWWPLFLILIGVIRLVEYYMAKQEGTAPPSIGGGTVLLMIFVIIIGLTITGVYKVRNEVNWGELRDQVGMDDDVMGLFGQNYTYEDQIEQDLPANTSVKVVSDRGSIAVSNWDQQKIKVVIHKQVFSPNNKEADGINQQTKPTIEISTGLLTVNANTQGAGRKGVVTNLEIYLPKNVPVEIAGRRGDVNISGRDADLKISDSRGDVVLDQIKGNVAATLNKGSLRTSQITGNITGDGRFDDFIAMDVTGSVAINGDVFGEVKLSKIGKGVKFHSSRTDLELAKLDGDLDLDSSELRATNITGPTTLNVRNKDVNFDSISGPVRIQGEKSDVTLQVGEKQVLGPIDISVTTGNVRLTMPGKANFQLQASTNHGDVNSDYPELKTATEKGRGKMDGTIGKGGSKIVINTNVGDIDVRKSTT
jgi:energy-coupling factor transporter transmembrane protein EcfT